MLMIYGGDVERYCYLCKSKIPKNSYYWHNKYCYTLCLLCALERFKRTQQKYITEIIEINNRKVSIIENKNRLEYITGSLEKTENKIKDILAHEEQLMIMKLKR